MYHLFPLCCSAYTETDPVRTGRSIQIKIRAWSSISQHRPPRQYSGRGVCRGGEESRVHCDCECPWATPGYSPPSLITTRRRCTDRSVWQNAEISMWTLTHWKGEKTKKHTPLSWCIAWIMETVILNPSDLCTKLENGGLEPSHPHLWLTQAQSACLWTAGGSRSTWRITWRTCKLHTETDPGIRTKNSLPVSYISLSVERQISTIET